MPGGMMMPGMGMPTGKGGEIEDGTKPRDTEIGLAVIIQLQYDAGNNGAWDFLYNLMQEDPLVEIDRLAMLNQSRPVRGRNRSLGGVETTANLIFVTKLFDTQEAVEKLLEEIQQTDKQGGAGSTASEGKTADAGTTTSTNVAP